MRSLTIHVSQPVYFRWRGKGYSFEYSRIAVCHLHGYPAVRIQPLDPKQKFLLTCCMMAARHYYHGLRYWWFGKTFLEAVEDAMQQHSVQEAICDLCEASNG